MDDLAAEHVPPPMSAPRALAWSALPPLAALAFAIAMHLVVVPHIDDYYGKILLDIGINIVLAVSLNIVNGMTGQFSIGHAGFMAVGGYTAAAITYYGSIALWGDAMMHGGLFSSLGNPAEYSGPLVAGGDLLFLGACLAGGLVAALAGFIVGLPSLRLRGDYLAIVTLGFGEIVRVLIQQTKPQLGPDQVAGVKPLEQLTHLGGALGFSGAPFYTTPFWAFLFVAATLIVAYRLRESTYGRAFFSIRENAIAAEAMGVPITRYKVSAFVIAAFFAGIAGSLFAHQIGNALSPGELGFQKSFDILIMVVLGGLGSISGATMAAVMLTILPELLRDPPTVWPIVLMVFAAALAIKEFHRRRAASIAVLALVAVQIALAVLKYSPLIPARVVGEALETDGAQIIQLKLVVHSYLSLASYAVLLVSTCFLRPRFGALWSAVAVVAFECLRIAAIKFQIDLSVYRMIFYALALILLMILRPRGLFGVNEIWDLWRPHSRRTPAPPVAEVAA